MFGTKESVLHEILENNFLKYKWFSLLILYCLVSKKKILSQNHLDIIWANTMTLDSDPNPLIYRDPDPCPDPRPDLTPKSIRDTILTSTWDPTQPLPLFRIWSSTRSWSNPNLSPDNRSQPRPWTQCWLDIYPKTWSWIEIRDMTLRQDLSLIPS